MKMLPAYSRGGNLHRMRMIGVLRRLGRDDDAHLPGIRSQDVGDGRRVTLDEVREMLGAAGWSLEEMK